MIMAVMPALASCSMSPVEWVDFEDFSSLDASKCFIPYSSGTSVLDEGALRGCRLPGGDSVGDVVDEDDTKVTGVGGAGIFTSLLSNFRSGRIRSYSGSYMSTDIDGDPIRLSGRIVIPADGKVSRIMVVAHFTVASDSEAPSNTVTMESMFAAHGLAVIEADYIGYGITADRVHPYLCSKVTAKNVVDMYYAALPFLEKIGCKPKYDDIFILGYSQGGAAAMSVTQEFNFHHPDVDIRLSMCGGGPYDICATYDFLVDNDYTDIPCAVPLILQGLDVGMHLGLNYYDFFLPRIADNLDEWINSKKYTVAEVTEAIGSHRVSDILTPRARDKAKDLMTDLYRAMVDNSVTSEFMPDCPLYLFHSIDDNVVPFVNSSKLEEHLYDMNVMYNFGHYGSHQMGCLRFMFSCIDLLKSHGDIY